MDENLDVHDNFWDGNESFKDPGRQGRRRPEEPRFIRRKYIILYYDNIKSWTIDKVVCITRILYSSSFWIVVNNQKKLSDGWLI